MVAAAPCSACSACAGQERLEVDVGDAVGVGQAEVLVAQGSRRRGAGARPVGVSWPGVQAADLDVGRPRLGGDEALHLLARGSRSAAGSAGTPGPGRSEITCHRIGRPPISTSGLGIDCVCSCRRVPRPPHKITTVGLMRERRWASWRRIIRHHPQSVTELAHPEVFKAYDVRGLYGDEIDAGTAHAIGRSFARVIGAMEDKPTSELRLGLGRDMRLTAPEMAAAYREGMVAEGASVVDAGMVGTEMLYYLVGSRDLDGGLMCTASHNPKAYTGAKLVGRGALALSGDAGLGEVRDRILERAGRGPRRRVGPGGRRLRGLPAGGAQVHRPVGDQAAEGRRRRRQRHGRPDGRSPARAPRAGSDRGLLDAGRQLPRSRAQPDAA